MRIVIVGTVSPWRGGIAHFNGLLAAELDQQHDVTVLTFTRQYPDLLFPGVDQRDEGEGGLDVGAQPILDSINPLSWRATAQRIREIDPDLLVMRYWIPFFAPAFGKVLDWSTEHGRPETVVVVDNIVPHDPRPFDRALTRWFVRKPDRFVVMSEIVRHDLLELKPNARVDLVPHPLYGQFGDVGSRQAARRKLGITEDANVMLFFGFIRNYKGLDVLLKAMPQVLEQLPVQLLVVGEFYESEASYRELVDTLGLSDAVRFVPDYVPNDEVAPYFAAANVVVLPYRHATQSGIIPVAYHMERPVISTLVGGLADVVDPENSGLLVPPEDTQSLAGAILHFFVDQMEESLRAGILSMRDQFSWSHFAETVVGTTGRRVPGE